MAWTTQQTIDYIKSQLGAPYRNVELKPENYMAVIKRALEQYAQAKPTLRTSFIYVQNGQNGYNLKDMGKPYGRGLLRGFQMPITSPAAVFTEYEYYRLRQPPYVDMSELVLDQMYYKEIGILTGTAFDWEWIQESTMVLFTPIPNRTFTFAYEYAADPDKIEDLAPTGQSWCVDFALALSKEILGRIRGKFKGVPGNDMNAELDWSELLSESAAACEKKVEDLYKYRGDWTPPIKG